VDVYDEFVPLVDVNRRTRPLVIDSDDGACFPSIWIRPDPCQRPVICNNLGCSKERKYHK
jgi:hypothetical protein